MALCMDTLGFEPRAFRMQSVIPLHHVPTCFMPLAFSALSPNACRRRPQSNLKEDRLRKQTARKTDSQQKLPARKADRRQKQTARETNRPQNQTAHQKTSQTDRPQKQILPRPPTHKVQGLHIYRARRYQQIETDPKRKHPTRNTRTFKNTSTLTKSQPTYRNRPQAQAPDKKH